MNKEVRNQIELLEWALDKVKEENRTPSVVNDAYQLQLRDLIAELWIEENKKNL